MPTLSIRRSMLANETVDNVLAGSAYEYLPWPAEIEIGIKTDANGVLATVSSGSDLLLEEGPIPIGTINTYPIYPDDFFLSDEAMQGDRLKVKLRDTSAAARVVMVSVKITPL